MPFDPSLLIFLKLLTATFLGLIVGAERSIVARQPAGMRTFALVSMGACMFIIASTALGDKYAALSGGFDPKTVASVLQGVVQGIGFIGAGVMFVRGESVHGITTAAGLWVSAAVGVFVAFDMYSVAIFAAALTLLVFFGMWYVEHMFKAWYDSKLAQSNRKTQDDILR